MQQAFIIRPFGTKRDSSGQEIDFDRVHKDLIGPALVQAELDARQTAGAAVNHSQLRLRFPRQAEQLQ